MLHILGMILKIAGILLGSILGILLLILLLVLFVPVRYQIQGSYHEEKRMVRARISWLLSLLSVRILYEGKGVAVRIRLLGIPLKKKEKKEKEEKKPDPEIPKTAGHVDREEEKAEHADWKEEKAAEEREGQETEEIPVQSLTDKIQVWIQKIKCTIQGICDKIKAVRAKKEGLQAFLKDEGNKEALHLLKEQLICLFRIIRPRRLSAVCHFGFEDPAVTGQVLAAAAVCYPLYQDKLRLYPDFQQKVLAGEADMRGRIRIFPLLLIIIRLWKNRTVREAVKRFMK